MYSDLDRPIAKRKGVRSCTQHPLHYYLTYTSLSPTYRAFITSLEQIQIPNSVQEALGEPEWRAATLEELRAHEKNETWTLTNLPLGKCIVGCKWIFSVKHKTDGSVERFKAHIVAKRFTQSYGIDYQEIFAPVAKLNTIRVLLSIVVNLECPLFQLEMKNAFINGELLEEVYMDTPPGFEDMFTKGKVCKLKKSLYGLKLSPQAWFDRYMRVLRRYGYTQCQSGHTLFVKHLANGRFTVLIVYVGDIVLTGNCEEEMVHLKQLLSKSFEIKDLGQLRYFLGMEVARSSQGISISQRKYALDLLKENGMIGCRPVETLLDPKISNLKLKLRELPLTEVCTNI